MVNLIKSFNQNWSQYQRSNQFDFLCIISLARGQFLGLMFNCSPEIKKKVWNAKHNKWNSHIMKWQTLFKWVHHWSVESLIFFLLIQHGVFVNIRTGRWSLSKFAGSHCWLCAGTTICHRLSSNFQTFNFDFSWIQSGQLGQNQCSIQINNYTGLISTIPYSIIILLMLLEWYLDYVHLWD